MASGNLSSRGLDGREPATVVFLNLSKGAGFPRTPDIGHPEEGGAATDVSDCVYSQAIRCSHGVPLSATVLRTMRSFRITAVIATFHGFPSAIRR